MTVAVADMVIVAVEAAVSVAVVVTVGAVVVSVNPVMPVVDAVARDVSSEPLPMADVLVATVPKTSMLMSILAILFPLTSVIRTSPVELATLI